MTAKTFFGRFTCFCCCFLCPCESLFLFGLCVFVTCTMSRSSLTFYTLRFSVFLFSTATNFQEQIFILWSLLITSLTLYLLMCLSIFFPHLLYSSFSNKNRRVQYFKIFQVIRNFVGLIDISPAKWSNLRKTLVFLSSRFRVVKIQFHIPMFAQLALYSRYSFLPFFCYSLLRSILQKWISFSPSLSPFYIQKFHWFLPQKIA